jgi:hypothetical protein
MNRIAVAAAAVLLANIVNIDRTFEVPAAAQDRVANIVAEAKKALGGDTLAGVKSVRAEGPFRRSMGPRDMEGTLSLTVMRPDKLRRSEEMSMGGMVGGPTVERVSGFNGAEAWDDIQNRGGMGGGMQMVIRGGPGDPARGGPGGPGVPLTEAQIAEQRARRMRIELQRWSVALFADSSQPFTDAGVAESPDGKADVLETKDEAGRAVRLFIDQASHLPLMVQYLEIRPRVMISGGPGGPGGRPGGGPAGPGSGAPGGAGAPGSGGSGGAGAAGTAAAPGVSPAPGASGAPGAPGTPAAPGGLTEEQVRERVEEMRRQGPPQPSQFAMHLGDYKNVNGVMLPHKIDISIEGQPNEEWTIETFKVNPSIKADEFNKPKE